MSAVHTDASQFTETESLTRVFDLLREYAGKLSEITTRAGTSLPGRQN